MLRFVTSIIAGHVSYTIRPVLMVRDRVFPWIMLEDGTLINPIIYRAIENSIKSQTSHR